MFYIKKLKEHIQTIRKLSKLRRQSFIAKCMYLIEKQLTMILCSKIPMQMFDPSLCHCLTNNLIEIGFFPVKYKQYIFSYFFYPNYQSSNNASLLCNISLLWYQVVDCIRGHTDLQSMKKCKEKQLDKINISNKA